MGDEKTNPKILQSRTNNTITQITKRMLFF